LAWLVPLTPVFGGVLWQRLQSAGVLGIALPQIGVKDSKWQFTVEQVALVVTGTEVWLTNVPFPYLLNI
jgi:hypothetical protein